MRHRDSMGVKQVRPAPPRPSIILPVVESILTRSRTHIIQSHTRTTAQPTQVYGDGAAQFLSAGRGVLHEEMWELQGGPSYQDIELFQLWINLPRGQKGMQPSIQTTGACATSGGGEAQSKGPIPTVTVPSSFPLPLLVNNNRPRRDGGGGGREVAHPAVDARDRPPRDLRARGAVDFPPAGQPQPHPLCPKGPAGRGGGRGHGGADRHVRDGVLPGE